MRRRRAWRAPGARQAKDGDFISAVRPPAADCPPRQDREVRLKACRAMSALTGTPSLASTDQAMAATKWRWPTRCRHESSTIKTDAQLTLLVWLAGYSVLSGSYEPTQGHTPSIAERPSQVIRLPPPWPHMSKFGEAGLSIANGKCAPGFAQRPTRGRAFSTGRTHLAISDRRVSPEAARHCAG